MYLKRCHTAMIFFGQKQLTAKKLLFPQKKKFLVDRVLNTVLHRKISSFLNNVRYYFEAND